MFIAKTVVDGYNKKYCKDCNLQNSLRCDLFGDLSEKTDCLYVTKTAFINKTTIQKI